MTNQDTNKGLLSEKQLNAIPLIIASRTMTEGAEKNGISRNTIYEWLKNPVFKAELQRQREVVVEEALEQLKTHAVKAVDNLGELLDTRNEFFRKNVSLDIINLAIKSREQSNIAKLEKRVAELEELFSECTESQTK